MGHTWNLAVHVQFYMLLQPLLALLQPLLALLQPKAGGFRERVVGLACAMLAVGMAWRVQQVQVRRQVRYLDGGL